MADNSTSAVPPATEARIILPERPAGRASSFGAHKLSMASLTVHADDYINSNQAVAPPMHVSTTFRYSDDPEKLRPGRNLDVRSRFPGACLSKTCFSHRRQ